MNYADALNKTLTSPEMSGPQAIDLFAGCGGLALGFEAWGFETFGYEMDKDACATYKRNLHRECQCVIMTKDTVFPKVQVVIGGPPCQPFSVGGLQQGLKDSRDGFPIFLSAIEQASPDIWLFENVRGLLYSNKWYFEQILTALKSLNYVVEYRLLNAVNFGVPQNRERVIVVGHRGEFKWPEPKLPRVTAGEALGEMAMMTPPESRFLNESMDAYIAKYEKASFCIRPRDLHLDQPARTLTCRNLAGATGDMHRIRLLDGRRRRLLLREAARLQSFPDWFEFEGGENSKFNQVGNAVPPLFAYHLAGSVRAYLESAKRLPSSEIVYKNLPDQLSLDLGFQVHEDSNMQLPTFVTSSKKPRPVVKVINQGLFILQRLGIPFEGLSERRLEKMSMAFLAVADVRQESDWVHAKAFDGTRALKSRDIIAYVNKHFHEQISKGSYDDIRRKDLKLPVAGNIIIKSAIDPNSARNDPTRGYALSPEYAGIIRAFGTEGWEDDLEEFLSERETLSQKLSGDRFLKNVPVKLPQGKKLTFSPGEHNELQRRIIEEFLPRFGNGADVLYVGDTANKLLWVEKEKLAELNFFELSHGELPDIIAYSKSRNWLYLIEAVHSSGPISQLRLAELRDLTIHCRADILFVTAFFDRKTFRQFAPEIAWETEVWIAETPDHVIHFDGLRFLGPYKRSGQ